MTAKIKGLLRFNIKHKNCNLDLESAVLHWESRIHNIGGNVKHTLLYIVWCQNKLLGRFGWRRGRSRASFSGSFDCLKKSGGLLTIYNKSSGRWSRTITRYNLKTTINPNGQLAKITVIKKIELKSWKHSMKIYIIPPKYLLLLVVQWDALKV